MFTRNPDRDEDDYENNGGEITNMDGTPMS